MIWSGLDGLILVLTTLSGYSPAVYAGQYALLAATRFCQNWMSRAVIGMPSDHFQPLSVTVTDFPSFEYTGGSARLRLWFSSTCPPVPNQYSGRYMRYWNWNRFAAVKYWFEASGRM